MPLVTFAGIYIAAMAAGGITNLLNGKWNRNIQKELAEKNQQFQERLEQNRQDFQLQRHLENANLQRELSEQNHLQRLAEQENNFKLMCAQTEWNLFLNHFPLEILPSVLRKFQINDDGTVALQVLFNKSNNQNFSKFIYPRVEQGLRQFIQFYHNVFNSKNIIFYQNAYKDNVYGDSFTANIRYAMNNMPVLVIDTNVLLDKTSITMTIWGFNNNYTNGIYQSTMFEIPYDLQKTNGTLDANILNNIADELLAHLKFAIGYIYDMYNLITYNHPPILPKVAGYEIKKSPDNNDNILKYENLRNQLSIHYKEIYSSILGSNEDHTDLAFLEIPGEKKIILHKLRLDYALSVKELVTQEEYLKYLDESIKSWCRLRTESPATEFINSFKDNREIITKYFSKEDIEYFEKLCTAYQNTETSSDIGKLCLETRESILNIKDIISDSSSNAITSTNSNEKVQKRKFLEL